MTIAQRVAARFLVARGIPMGDTYQNPSIRVHRYRDHFRIQDLTNAGKRGKKVPDLLIGLNYNFKGDRDTWLEEQSFQLLKLTRSGNPYGSIKKYIEDLAKKVDGINVEETSLRGVDVEPYGQVFEFKIPLDNKGHIEVESSPNDFRVTHHSWMNHPTNPDGPGHFQDTSYWPRKKTDARAFYAWMQENDGKARRFQTMDDFRGLWRTLGIQYDYH